MTDRQAHKKNAKSCIIWWQLNLYALFWCKKAMCTEIIHCCTTRRSSSIQQFKKKAASTLLTANI